MHRHPRTPSRARLFHLKGSRGVRTLHPLDERSGHDGARKVGLVSEIVAAYLRSGRAMFRRQLPQVLALLRERYRRPPREAARKRRQPWPVAHAFEGSRAAATDSPCLIQSLVLLSLLERRGYPDELVIGARSAPTRRPRLDRARRRGAPSHRRARVRAARCARDHDRAGPEPPATRSRSTLEWFRSPPLAGPSTGQDRSRRSPRQSSRASCCRCSREPVPRGVSGGKDSSMMLAVATSVARANGLADPVP